MPNPPTQADRLVAFSPSVDRGLDLASAAGRPVALAGVVLPLALIGLLKFTQVEIDALRPLISNTPWLAWLYPAFGVATTSYILGVAELTTAALFILSIWSNRAGVLAGVLGAATFGVTTSTLLAVPIWEASSGGFPWLNFLGCFLIKDIALLGVSLMILGDSLARHRAKLFLKSLDPASPRPAMPIAIADAP